MPVLTDPGRWWEDDEDYTEEISMVPIRLARTLIACIVVGLSGMAPARALNLTEVHLGTDDFVTIRNNTPSPIDFAGYTLRIRNSAQGPIDFALPDGVLESGSAISVTENPAPGFDIDVPQNLLWSASSDLSIALIDPGQTVVDFVAIGSTIVDPPAGVTFSPGAFDPSGIDEQTQSVVRFAVTGSPPNFSESDWAIGGTSGPALGQLSYVVGGNVNGLEGSGLVLQNNAGDDLAVSASGPFVFANRLADGSAYVVSVAAQPADPAQTCAVTNASGTLMGANVSNVIIDCVTDAANLGVTKTDAQETLASGDPVTYMITVTNAGPFDVTGALVQDTLPAELSMATWECFPGAGASCTASGAGDIVDTIDIPAGESVNYSLTAATDLEFRGVISNTVTVTTPSNLTDPDPSNNSATDTTSSQALFQDGFEDPLAAFKRWLKGVHSRSIEPPPAG